MENLSENIEQYILDLLREESEENFVSLRRKELAERFDCVPSQINYVLRSRFRPEQGYLVESRRGEYGYIKIVRIVCPTPNEKARHIEDLIGRMISLRSAEKLLQALHERNMITSRERLLIDIAIRQIKPAQGINKDRELADLLKKMLGALMLRDIE